MSTVTAKNVAAFEAVEQVLWSGKVPVSCWGKEAVIDKEEND